MNTRQCAHCGANMHKRWAWVKSKDGRVLCRACGLAQWTFASNGRLVQNTPEWFDQLRALRSIEHSRATSSIKALIARGLVERDETGKARLTRNGKLALRELEQRDGLRPVFKTIHIEGQMMVQHDVYEHDRFYTLEYRRDGVSSTGTGIWSFRVAGTADDEWRPVQLLRIRRLLDAGNHPRAGEYRSVWAVVENATPRQLDQWHDEQMISRLRDEQILDNERGIMIQQEQELDYDAYIAEQEREHWAQLDAEQAEREEQAWFEENEEVSLEEACPHCGRYGVTFEPDTQRPCGCPDTERVICAHCGECLGLAQYDPCDCAEWTCEDDDALAYEEWDGEL